VLLLCAASLAGEHRIAWFDELTKCYAQSQNTSPFAVTRKSHNRTEPMGFLC
jgi:hypothetical protein